jgi:hypothetical protein
MKNTLRFWAAAAVTSLMLLVAGTSVASAHVVASGHIVAGGSVARAHPAGALRTLRAQEVLAVKPPPKSVSTPRALAVNGVTAKFTTQLALCRSGASYRLCKVIIQPANISYGFDFICVASCTYASKYKFTSSGHSLVLHEDPAQRLHKGEIFAELLQAPGTIGRYRIYKVVDPDNVERAFVGAGNGCFAAHYADTTAFLNTRPIPTVPCVQPIAADEITAAGTLELSATSKSYLSVFDLKHAARGTRSVAMFVAHGRCEANSLEEFEVAKEYYSWKTSNISAFFGTAIVTALRGRGWICVYAQTGTLWHNLPYGRVTSVEAQPYWSGDTVTGPTNQPVSGSSVSTSYTGAPATSQASWVVADSKVPCADSSAELAGEIANGDATVLQSDAIVGTFSYTASAPAPTASEFQCSYIDEVGPSGWYEPVNLEAMSSTSLEVNGAPVAGTTFPETVKLAETPVSNPLGDAGASSTVVTAGESVSVRCFVYGFAYRTGDGSSVIWLQLASAPWSDDDYVPAAAFNSDGLELSGVPHCGAS